MNLFSRGFEVLAPIALSAAALTLSVASVEGAATVSFATVSNGSAAGRTITFKPIDSQRFFQIKASMPSQQTSAPQHGSYRLYASVSIYALTAGVVAGICTLHPAFSDPARIIVGLAAVISGLSGAKAGALLRAQRG